MCTLTWFNTDQGYEVFFNRDEQRARKVAIPPQRFLDKNVEVIIPTDPDGGGSWISVNQHGMTLCLLNYYQGTIPRRPLISRGLLLRSLARLAEINEVTQQLLDIDLGQYAPFTLVVFQPQQSTQFVNTFHDVNELCFCWDGEELTNSQPANFMTSSSVKFDEVCKSRQRVFSDSISKKTADQHLFFHKGHDQIQGQNQPNFRSVCMHREDAKTVSFSHIQVSDSAISFDYINGSPCEPTTSSVNQTIKSTA